MSRRSPEYYRENATRMCEAWDIDWTMYQEITGVPDIDAEPMKAWVSLVEFSWLMIARGQMLPAFLEFDDGLGLRFTTDAPVPTVEWANKTYADHYRDRQQATS